MNQKLLDKGKGIKEGIFFEYSNHAGKHIVEYIREIDDGAYTKMIGKWNGFNEEVTHECFRYQGVIQNGWKLFNHPTHH